MVLHFSRAECYWNGSGPLRLTACSVCRVSADRVTTRLTSATCLVVRRNPAFAQTFSCGASRVPGCANSPQCRRHFAIAGGSPLHGDRFFAGQPDTLEFEIAIIAESALYPWLDSGTRSGGYFRVLVDPPVAIPLSVEQVTGVTWSHVPGKPEANGAKLPLHRVGSIAVDIGGVSGPLFDNSSSAQASPPAWLGAFTVEAYHEIVVLRFEVAAVASEVDAGVDDARANGLRRRRGFKERATRQSIPFKPPRASRRRAEELSTGRDYAQLGEQFSDSTELREQGESELSESRDPAGHARGATCTVTVCAAAAQIPSWGIGKPESDGDGDGDGDGDDGSDVHLCRSIDLPARGGNGTSGTLELPADPQAGRWYLFARSSCDDVGGTVGDARNGGGRRVLLGATPSSVDNGLSEVAVDAIGSRSSPGADGQVEGRHSVGSPEMTVVSLQRDWAQIEWRSDEEMLAEAMDLGGREFFSEMDEEVTSGNAGIARNGSVFVLSAAVDAQSCPPGRAGVQGVDLVRLEIPRVEATDETESGELEKDDTVTNSRARERDPLATVRLRCLGEVLPTVMEPDGEATMYTGSSARRMSNVVSIDEAGRWHPASRAHSTSGGATGATSRGRKNGTRMGGSERRGLAEGGGASPAPALLTAGSSSARRRALLTSEESSTPQELTGQRWRWEGPDPPSLWYAVEMSGREIGAAVAIKVAAEVNSSSPIAAIGPSPTGTFKRRAGLSSSPREEGSNALPSSDDEEQALQLRVAVRVGGLPVIDTNGTGREGTRVLGAADALVESGGMVDSPVNASQGVGMWWSTSFTWNMTRLPAMASTSSMLTTGGISAAVTHGGPSVARTSTTLFVSVSCQAAGVQGGMEAELWAADVLPEVSLRYCDEETCPSHRGECRRRGGWSSANDHVEVSECLCMYGLGGEACGQRVVSRFSIFWQVLLLVGSNLAVIPGVRVALKLAGGVGAAPSVVLAFNGIASAMYHLCDLEITCVWGLLSYHSLQAMDFFFSFFSVAALVLFLCPMPWDEPFVKSSRQTIERASRYQERLERRSPRSAVGNEGSEASSHGTDTADKAEEAQEVRGGDARFAERRLHASSRRREDGGSVYQRRRQTNQSLRVDDEISEAPYDRDMREDDASAGDGIRTRGSRSDFVVQRFAAGGQELGDRAGSRLASLYVCIVPPLLMAVTSNPTDNANIVLVVALCVGFLTFSWGRIIVQDLGEMEHETVSENSQDFPPRVGSVPGRFESSEESRGVESEEQLGLLSVADQEGQSSTLLLAQPPLEVAAGSEPGAASVTCTTESRQVESSRNWGEVTDEDGQGGGNRGAESNWSESLPTRNRWNRSPSSATRRVSSGARGSRTDDGVGHEAVMEVTAIATGWRIRAGFCLYFYLRKLRTILRSCKRVLVDRRLVDWRQMGFGVLMFSAGVLCFALQGMPRLRKFYHIVHSIWHVCAMGSAVPLLKARKW